MPTACLPDCNLYYERHGAGRPPLVFVHGGYCSHGDWVNQVAALQQDFTIVTLDLPGHGASSGECGAFTVKHAAKCVTDLIGELKLAPAIILGHSLGARVVLQAAADQPSAILGVVLLDGSRLRSSPASAAETPPELSDEMMKQFMISSFETMFCEKTGPVLRNQINAMLQATSVPDMVSFFKAVENWDIEELEPTLTKIGAATPVLAIQSTFHDHASKRASLENMAATTPWLELLKSRLRNLQIAIAPGLGHFHMIEAPDQINGPIRSFVRAIS